MDEIILMYACVLYVLLRDLLLVFLHHAQLLY